MEIWVVICFMSIAVCMLTVNVVDRVLCQRRKMDIT